MMMLGCHRKVVDFSLISILKWESKVTVITGVAKAGFHWQRSRSRSRKSASDLVKIENRSRKRSHKFDGIGDGRISLDNNVFSHLGSKDEKKTNDGHHDKSDHFRAQIESGMRDLDGPELLQFAMKFVQSALKKSQVGNQLNLQV